MNGEFNNYEPNRLPEFKNGEVRENNSFENTDLNLNRQVFVYSERPEDNEPSPKDNVSPREKIKKSEGLRTKILTAATAVVGAVIVGVVPVADVFSTTEKVDYSLYASANGVRYEIILDEKEGDLDRILTILVQNDFTNRVQQVEGYYAQGVFENLQENMTYTFKVMDGSKTLVSDTFKTVKSAEFSLQEFSVEETSVWGFMSITDYSVKKELSVSVTDGRETVSKRVILQSDGEEWGQDYPEDETTYCSGWISEGVIQLDFWFEDLKPSTEYTLSLSDNKKTLFTHKFKTGVRESDSTYDEGQG